MNFQILILEHNIDYFGIKKFKKERGLSKKRF